MPLAARSFGLRYLSPKEFTRMPDLADRYQSECPLLAQSRHGVLHCTCLLSGVERT